MATALQSEHSTKGRFSNRLIDMMDVRSQKRHVRLGSFEEEKKDDFDIETEDFRRK